MTQDDDPKRLTDWELDRLRYSAEQRDIVDVASKDLRALCDEVTGYRRRHTHPYATLLALLPAAGVVAWLFTGEWRWAILGLLGLFAAAAVGTSIDGAKRKRGDR